ncbi:uncharacterized protein TNCV_1968181 [Trichonephila clavipes]|nr:uncharacterized protein TNCV_1968181 [Trichonephila clavipes]
MGSLVVRASDSRPEGWSMPPTTLRVQTEYVLVKSVGPKVLWAESRVQGTAEYFPPLQFHAKIVTATAGSDVVQSGRPIFDDFFQHLWPYIGNNTANVVFQMVKRLWLIRIDQ